MTVTYTGNSIYEVSLAHPEHPVGQSFSMTRQDVLDLLEAVDKVEFFDHEDFPFFDFVVPVGG